MAASGVCGRSPQHWSFCGSKEQRAPGSWQGGQWWEGCCRGQALTLRWRHMQPGHVLRGLGLLSNGSAISAAPAQGPGRRPPLPHTDLR